MSLTSKKFLDADGLTHLLQQLEERYVNYSALNSLIPLDISDLSDNNDLIPADLSDLTDSNNLLQQYQNMNYATETYVNNAIDTVLSSIETALEAL